ncbi:MAG: SURF1 family protein [Actinomycetota bacterium]|nr:SURF1 family protein [Actinomycetota bacterium]MDA3008105.1 SURF1 family protein [Actinomycetota bacterium]MDA3035174.1 SURF1 family protein [Actinomycetota bacterium]
MYRFALTPRWIAFHLVIATAAVVMVNLGLWQLRRLDERRDFNATVEQRWDAAPIDIAVLLPPGSTSDDADSHEWQSVTAQGRYVNNETIRVVNRSQNGRAGDNVVVPLRLDDGRLLLVTRGFVPLGQDPSQATDSNVTITGHLRVERAAGALAARDPADGELTEVQRIDIARLAEQMPGDLVPAWVDLTASAPPEVGPWPEPVIRPDLSEGSHLSYAVQWFIFSIAVIVGWVVALRTTARRQHAAAAASTAEPS